MNLDKKILNILVERHVHEYVSQRKNMKLLASLSLTEVDFGGCGDSIGSASPSADSVIPAGGPGTSPEGTGSSTSPEQGSATDISSGGPNTIPLSAGEEKQDEKGEVLGEPDVVSNDELEDDELDELDLGQIGQAFSMVQTVMSFF